MKSAPPLSACPVANLSGTPGRIVSVICVVRTCGSEVTFKAGGTGREGVRRQIQLSDVSGDIALTLFDTKVKELEESNVGQVVAISGASLGMYSKFDSTLRTVALCMYSNICDSALTLESLAL